MSNSIKAKLIVIGYISSVMGLNLSAVITESDVLIALGLLILFMPVFLALYLALTCEMEEFLDRRNRAKDLRDYLARRPANAFRDCLAREGEENGN